MAASVTFGALNVAAERLASKLVQQADATKFTIGVCCQRGERNIIAILAALKCGKPFVPLDPTAVRESRCQLSCSPNQPITTIRCLRMCVVLCLVIQRRTNSLAGSGS